MEAGEPPLHYLSFLTNPHAKNGGNKILRFLHEAYSDVPCKINLLIFIGSRRESKPLDKIFNACIIDYAILTKLRSQSSVQT